MTCGMSLLSDDRILIAADKRSSHFTESGEYVGTVSDEETKILILKNNAAVFLGGLAEITKTIKTILTAKDEDGLLKTVDDVIREITRLCRNGHNLHKGIAERMGLPIGTVVCILAAFQDSKPVQLGFMAEFDFTPVDFQEKHRVLFKSSNDDLAAELLNRLGKEVKKVQDFPSYMRKVFKELSKQERTISAECDLYEVRENSVKKLDELIETHMLISGKVRVSENLTVENEAGTVKVTSTGIQVTDPEKAQALFKAGTMALMAWNPDTGTWDYGLYFDIATRKFIFNGTLSATVIEAIKANIDVIVSNTVIIQNLYSEYGRIANLSVNELNTGWKKIINYLVSDTSDVNYTWEYEEHRKQITASTDGTQTEQATDKDNNPLYWTDDTHTGMTLDATSYPVMTYVYTELVKREDTFLYIDDEYIPTTIWGAGAGIAGHPDWGKTYTYKDATGYVIKYLKSFDGEEIKIKLGDNGIEGVDFCVTSTNTALVDVGSGAEVAVTTKDIIFSQRSRAIISFTAKVAPAASLNLTAKVYVDGVALALQPIKPFINTNLDTISFTLTKAGISTGTKTITVKLITSTSTATVAISDASMIVQVFTDPMPALPDITGFTTEAIGATQINLAWTNPMSTYFAGVEVYRHTSGLSSHDRAWCDANATLVYSGSNQSYNNTGLAAGTTYYYKIFVKHDVEGNIYYSNGVEGNETTIFAPPILQSAATNTAGTVITLTFSKAMANPSGKHAQFSATIAGSSRSISAAALNADTTKIDLTVSGAAITSGQTVTISYTAGDVAASDGSPLASFSGQSVTNNAVSAYQTWQNYSQTPDLTTSFPYQTVGYRTGTGTKILIVSTTPMQYDSSTRILKSATNSGTMKTYTAASGVSTWTAGSSTSGSSGFSMNSDFVFSEANNNIFTNSTMTTIYFSKTTP